MEGSGKSRVELGRIDVGLVMGGCDASRPDCYSMVSGC